MSKTISQEEYLFKRMKAAVREARISDSKAAWDLRIAVAYELAAYIRDSLNPGLGLTPQFTQLNLRNVIHDLTKSVMPTLADARKRNKTEPRPKARKGEF